MCNAPSQITALSVNLLVRKKDGAAETPPIQPIQEAMISDPQ